MLPALDHVDLIERTRRDRMQHRHHLALVLVGQQWRVHAVSVTDTGRALGPAEGVECDVFQLLQLVANHHEALGGCGEAELAGGRVAGGRGARGRGHKPRGRVKGPRGGNN